VDFKKPHPPCPKPWSRRSVEIASHPAAMNEHLGDAPVAAGRLPDGALEALDEQERSCGFSRGWVEGDLTPRSRTRG
jgi:hypothetical protein